MDPRAVRTNRRCASPIARRFFLSVSRSIAPRLFCCTLLGSLALSVVLAAPANGDPRAATVEAPAEFVRVRLLELNVLATDREGNPHEALDASDLTVKWRDEPLAFRLIRSTDPAADGTEPADMRLTLRFGSEERTATATRAPPRHLLLFIDLGADLRGKKSGSPQSVLRFLEETRSPGDRVAVITFNGRLHHEIAFDEDPDRIADAVRAAFGRSRAPGQDTRQRIQSLITRVERCENVMDGSLQIVDDQGRPIEPDGAGGNGGNSGSQTGGSVAAVVTPVDAECVRDLARGYVDEAEQRATLYLRSLEETIRYAAGLHEDVTVIGLTHGVSLSPELEFAEVVRGMIGETSLNGFRATLAGAETASAAFDSLRELARRERVSLQFVDAARKPSGIRSARYSRLFVDNSSPFELAHRLPQAPLSELAASTAGIFVRSDDLYDGLMRAAGADAGRFPLMVYLPDEADAEPWRRLRVESNRPEIRVTWAVAGGDAAPEQDETALSMEFARAREIEDRTDWYVPFALGVRPSAMDYREDGVQRVADLSLYLTVRSETAEHVVSFYHLFRHSLKAEDWESRKDTLLALRGWIETPPGRYRISAAVRNVRSGLERTVVKDLRVETR